MIRVLRHAGLRLWLLLLWGVPLGFWLLPRGLSWLPDLSASTAMACFLILSGLGQGLLLDLMGKKRVLGLIREGERWEQAGIRSRAEDSYARAVRIFDSVLVSPWSVPRLSRDLTRVMAGFYLAGPVAHPGFRMAAARYLLYAPGDETLAQLWLERYMAGKEREDQGLNQPVLTALAQVHHDHPQIAMQLAIPFLDEERNDFQARRLYRSLLKHLESARGSTGFPRIYVQKMRALLGPETALTGADLPETAPLGRGDASQELTLGDRIFSPDRMGPYQYRRQRSMAKGAGRLLYQAMSGVAQVLLLTLRLVGNAIAALPRFGSHAAGVLREWEGFRQFARYTLISVLALGLGYFIWSALTIPLPGQTPVVHPVGSPADGPYTIQVAAYLKETHADLYVKKLSAKGVAARIKTTQGGGKTWYLVRISYFKTKEIAADFGRQLKGQGKIEDFFVTQT